MTPEHAAAGKWIAEHATWTHVAHLTFTADVSEKRAHDALRRMRRGVAIMAGDRHVRMAYGRERTADGRVHYHALLAFPDHQPDKHMAAMGMADGPEDVDYSAAIRSAWLNSDASAGGKSRVEPYDRQRGAAWYLAKGDDWTLDVACPRQHVCRRNGCVEEQAMKQGSR